MQYGRGERSFDIPRRRNCCIETSSYTDDDRRLTKTYGCGFGNFFGDIKYILLVNAKLNRHDGTQGQIVSSLKTLKVNIIRYKQTR